ncbi:5-formyltetrahydrofolate cyclo-ligase [Buchnera aphidicola]|uniref:5-formyltetrahydrofolate cyclo-ligase n=1 Tax=Buchnera aphidicola TaxID=9 RepID=UPI00346405E2
MAEKKNIFLPVISTLEKRKILFYEYHSHSILIKNIFGIFEPKIKDKICLVDNLDLIFLPLVAFNKFGNRLGMGKGFYDHTLACSKKNCFLVGLAYDFQYFNTFSINAWDISLFSVFTPSKYIIF